MLFGEVFLQMLHNFRIAWIGGRYGGGKTALSVRLAYEFIARGWSKYAIGNFPCVLFHSLDNLPDLRDCFVVLDEVGSWMQGRTFDRTVAFLRKRNLVLVMPSVLPPPFRARVLTVQRTANLQRVGLDVWRYHMRLDYMRVHEKEVLLWVRPSEVFGLWDTNYVTTDSEGIVETIASTFEKGKHRAITNARIFAAERLLTPPVQDGDRDEFLDQLRRITEENQEAAQRIEDAVSFYQRNGRTRRF